MTRFSMAAIIVFGAAITCAQMPNPKTAPGPVHGQGCVASGVEAGCLVVRVCY